MDKLYDKNPICNSYVKEEYIGYGKNEFSKLSIKELQESKKRAEKDLEGLTKELENADKEFPTYSIKECIKNVQYEIEQIENEIAKRELDNQKEKTKNDDSHIFKSFKSDLKDYKK